MHLKPFLALLIFVVLVAPFGQGNKVLAKNGPVGSKQRLVELPFDSVDLFRIESSQRGHEFSGLTVSPQGKLYTVSDNVWDASIYRLDIDESTGDRARCVPLVVDTSALGQRAYDWEGICSLDDQTFFLLNERGDGNELSCRIAKVSFTKGSKKGKAIWHSPSLLQRACRLSLSPVEPNKSLEGIALLSHKEPLSFLLAFERVERTILHLSSTGNLAKVKETEEASYEHYFKGRGRGSASFSGLAFEGPDKLFVAVRNCSAVAKFKFFQDKEGANVSLAAIWSFAHILKGRGLWNWWNSPDHKEPFGYGMAEGVCTNKEFVYVIFDTQNCFSPKGTKDYRTPLLRFRRPDRLW